MYRIKTKSAKRIETSNLPIVTKALILFVEVHEHEVKLVVVLISHCYACSTFLLRLLLALHCIALRGILY